jgi:UDP-N-acetylmuramoyl-tripeptide--D-alanyl-D-alanine ligase
MPLALLAAPADTQAVVLEMAMRGAGQIAELTAIAEPDVGVIVNVGPAHLELLGSIEAIAAAKAELIAGLAAGADVVVPAGEALLARHLREDLEVTSFGEDGDVQLRERRTDGSVVVAHRGREMLLRPSFSQAHNLRNLLAAVAAAQALGHTPDGALEVRFSSMRGQCVELPGGVLLINDCYNANPMSMRAALEDLAATAERQQQRRRVAVLGDMLELGDSEREFHVQVGEQAGTIGVDLLVTVGSRAAAMSDRFAGAVRSANDAVEAAALVPELLHPGDVVLVKGSRGVGLELVCRALRKAGSG